VREGRRARGRPAGWAARRQENVAADTAVPPRPAGRRDGGRQTGRAPELGTHNGHGRRLRPYGGRDGVSDGLCRGRAHRVRHVQGRQ